MVFQKKSDLTLTMPCSKMDIGERLRDSLLEAKEEGRLACGVYQAAEVLETNQDCVMMCVLAHNNTEDVTLNIYFTLIQALCAENDIRVLMVDSVEKVAKLIGEAPMTSRPPPPCGGDMNDNDLGQVSSITDYNCVLVEYPAVDFSEADIDLLGFHKMTCELDPAPTIPLAI